MRIRVTIEETEGFMAEENGGENLKAVAEYIIYNDPELERMVNKVLKEFEAKHALACGICPVHNIRHEGQKICPPPSTPRLWWEE